MLTADVRAKAEQHLQMQLTKSPAWKRQAQLLKAKLLPTSSFGASTAICGSGFWESNNAAYWR